MVIAIDEAPELEASLAHPPHVGGQALEPDLGIATSGEDEERFRKTGKGLAKQQGPGPVFERVEGFHVRQNVLQVAG
jgi:hypothetical protein